MSKHPGGRPLKFQSVQELEKKIDAYFKKCDKDKKPYTITGLALALDTSRETLVNYEDREEFFDTIKRAKLRCENYLEEGMITNRLNPTACIFNAKNNYGWRDKSEIDHTTDGKPIYGGLSAGTVQGHNGNEDNISTD